MIPLDSVARLRWNAKLGEKLKDLRGKTSRRSLAEQLTQRGHKVSHQFIQKLEDGKADTASSDLILEVCNILEISLGELIPVIHVDKFTTGG